MRTPTIATNTCETTPEPGPPSHSWPGKLIEALIDEIQQRLDRLREVTARMRAGTGAMKRARR